MSDTKANSIFEGFCANMDSYHASEEYAALQDRLNKLRVKDQFDLTGKVALVTGCANDSIGAAIAEGLAEMGADIAGLDIAPMTEAAEKVEALGRRFFPIRADLTDRTAQTACVDQVVAEFGRLDILVNAAGLDIPVFAEHFDRDTYDKMIEVNQNALVRLSSAAFAQMRKQGTGGKILNFTSVMAYASNASSLAYTVSKNAVIGTTLSMGVSGPAHGICVNAIAPGFVETKMTARWATGEVRNRVLWATPAFRPAHPNELKASAVFLCSPASDFISGTVLRFDAGTACNGAPFFI
jgi:2-deoxy-D-gluconate 3-dehydrogenase